MLMMPFELKTDQISMDKLYVLNYPVQKAHLDGVEWVAEAEWVVDSQAALLCQVSQPLFSLYSFGNLVSKFG